MTNIEALHNPEEDIQQVHCLRFITALSGLDLDATDYDTVFLRKAYSVEQVGPVPLGTIVIEVDDYSENHGEIALGFTLDLLAPYSKGGFANNLGMFQALTLEQTLTFFPPDGSNGYYEQSQAEKLLDWLEDVIAEGKLSQDPNYIFAD